VTVEQFGEEPGFDFALRPRLETKAIDLPSGAQTGWLASVEIVVSWRGSPPSRASAQIWVEPERSDSNAIHLPSADQCGARSCRGDWVSWRGSPPFTGTIHNDEVVLFSALIGSVTT